MVGSQDVSDGLGQWKRGTEGGGETEEEEDVNTETKTQILTQQRQIPPPKNKN